METFVSALLRTESGGGLFRSSGIPPPGPHNEFLSLVQGVLKLIAPW